MRGAESRAIRHCARFAGRRCVTFSKELGLEACCHVLRRLQMRNGSLHRPLPEPPLTVGLQLIDLTLRLRHPHVKNRGRRQSSVAPERR
jgi:hypothetical protein